MDQSAPNLPADVLERIFSVCPPLGVPGEPLLDVRDRLRGQLVCKTWRHALDARRWPLCHLELVAVGRVGAPPAPPPAALWLKQLRPVAVRDLVIELGTEDGLLDRRHGSLEFDEDAVQAVLAALLALHPAGALHTLSLTAPCGVLEAFMEALGRFTGLTRLQLRAESAVEQHPVEGELVSWDPDAVMRRALLRHLPPQLQSLTLANFDAVRLVTVSAVAAAVAAAGGSCGVAGAGTSTAPARLPPALSQLCISETRKVQLDMPLTSLAELTVDDCIHVRLGGERLHLPQLTSLRLLDGCRKPRLPCGAMPKLARLSCTSRAVASDSFTVLRHLTHLSLAVLNGSTQRASALLASVALSLRSLSVEVRPAWDIQCAWGAARELAAAGASQLTRLEFNGLACVAHLAAWPHLQQLLLGGVAPTCVTAERLALLAAAANLRRLEFSYSICGPIDHEQAERQEAAKLQELARVLPRCFVGRYRGSSASH